jgi:hypothetical protein
MDENLNVERMEISEIEIVAASLFHEGTEDPPLPEMP